MKKSPKRKAERAVFKNRVHDPRNTKKYANGKRSQRLKGHI